MTPDWILICGILVFAVTTWATLSFGYAYFRELGRQDDAAATADLVGGTADVATAIPLRDSVDERAIATGS